MDPSKRLQDKEKVDLTILKSVDLAKTAVVLKDCEALIGNELSRSKLSHPTLVKIGKPAENTFNRTLELPKQLLMSTV